MLNRSKDNPWKLKTPPGTSEYTMHTDEKDDKPVLVCTVGSTVLLYDARKPIRWAAGMASRKVCAAVLGSICHH